MLVTERNGFGYDPCLYIDLPVFSELTDLGVKRAHHDKGPVLGDPILNSIFGIVAFADTVGYAM